MGSCDPGFYRPRFLVYDGLYFYLTSLLTLHDDLCDKKYLH